MNLKNQDRLVDATTKLSLAEMENVNGGRRVKRLPDIVNCLWTYCYWP